MNYFLILFFTKYIYISFGILQGSPSAKLSSDLKSLDFRLPWRVSVDENRNLPYMKMLEAQLRTLKEIGAVEIPLDEEKAYRTNYSKKARIGNIMFQSDKFRKIRLTYFDGGQSVQVLN